MAQFHPAVPPALDPGEPQVHDLQFCALHVDESVDECGFGVFLLAVHFEAEQVAIEVHHLLHHLAIAHADAGMMGFVRVT